MNKPAKTPRTSLPGGIANVLKRLHHPVDVILLCVRWYVAYSLSLRDLEEMMAERGIEVDHSTVHRWVIKLLPVLEKAFRRRQRPVGNSWRMDETYILVKGQWKYLYRAVDKAGKTIDFLLRARRDTASIDLCPEIDQRLENLVIVVQGSLVQRCRSLGKARVLLLHASHHRSAALDQHMDALRILCHMEQGHAIYHRPNIGPLSMRC